jgi:hypothetical protein
MQIYHYNPETGEPTGQRQAKLDPAEAALGNTRYLIPKNATDQAPPKAGANEAAVWNGQAWELVADYRGTTHYDPATGEEMTIATLGESPDVTDPPPTELYQPTRNGAAWVETLTEAEIAQRELSKTDMDLTRVVEEVFELLFQDQIIKKSALSASTRSLLKKRTALRKKLEPTAKVSFLSRLNPFKRRA